MKKWLSMFAVTVLSGSSFSQETFQSVTDRPDGFFTSQGREIQFRSTTDAYTFVGGNTGYARIGAYGNSGWQKLTINEGGGNVGIGTATPSSRLDVNGNTTIRGVLEAILDDANIGGTISIRNPAKTALGTASTWNIYNMAGAYGNSLQFWAYDNTGCGSGGLCANRFTLMDNGNVGIGTLTPQSELAVKGTITSMKVKVSQNGWADYVFDSSYQLAPLDQVETFIKENKHLPGVPSAAEVKKDGLDLGDNQAVLLKKIEELTLYIIEQNKRLEEYVRVAEYQKQQLAVQKQINTTQELNSTALLTRLAVIEKMLSELKINNNSND